jgi:hypothetical protein
MGSTASQSAAGALNAEATIFAPGAASGSFRLLEFWAEAPANWFAMAEAQFLLRRVTSNIDKFCHVLMALPKTSYRLISHLVMQAPAEDTYEQPKAALMSHHKLSDYQEGRQEERQRQEAEQGGQARRQSCPLISVLVPC